MIVVTCPQKLNDFRPRHLKKMVDHGIVAPEDKINLRSLI
jgi:hypothetical protein